MDAIVGVWLSSVVGAAAFSAAGYVLGQSGRPAAAAASEKKEQKKGPGEPPASPSFAERSSEPGVAHAQTGPTPEVAALEKPKTPTAFPSQALLDRDEEEPEDRPTVVPDMPTHEAALQNLIATIPPSRTPSIRINDGFDHDATRAMIRDALDQVEAAAEQKRGLEIRASELERQLELSRAELRNEVIQRAAAEAKAEELSDRLARASEEASSLRHRVNMLDRQTKLLRESLKGNPAGASDGHRREQEAEEMRVKLRDVVNKLERASMPPLTTSGPPSSQRTTDRPPESMPRSFSGAFPGPAGLPRSMKPMKPMNEDAVVLREEIARLARENRTLRAQTLGSFPPKPERDNIPDIDLDLYQSLVDRLSSVAGLKGAVLADEVGSALLGGGDFAESLAAFGAYIRDSAARTDRLLPLEGVDEVDIRDRQGMLLSTRVIIQPSTLQCVLLASTDASMTAAKKIVDDTLRRKL